MISFNGYKSIYICGWKTDALIWWRRSEFLDADFYPHTAVRGAEKSYISGYNPKIRLGHSFSIATIVVCLKCDRMPYYIYYESMKKYTFHFDNLLIIFTMSKLLHCIIYTIYNC